MFGNYALGNATFAGIASGIRIILISETGSGAEILSESVTFTISDTGSGVDVATQIINFLISDSGSGVDALGAIAMQVNVADSAVGAEVLAIINSFTISDTGSGDDSILRFQFVYLYETGTGIDIIFRRGEEFRLIGHIKGDSELYGKIQELKANGEIKSQEIIGNIKHL